MRGASSFVHLDVRSCFSLKEGAFTPEQLAGRAAELGMEAVAMTDRDGLYGAARFVRACQQEGVAPILGASVTMRAPGPPGERGHERDAHVVLLAIDDTGYANLCRLLTDAHMLGERGDPWLDPRQICAHASGLVAIAGPRSHPGRAAVAGRIDAGARLLDPFREAFGVERLFVGVEHRVERDSAEEARALLRLAQRMGVRAVATNPVRYLEPGDGFVADALECMRRIVPIADTNISRRNAEGWLKPAAQMRALFDERSELADTTREIADMCSFDLGLDRIYFPDFPTPAGRSADALLAERCWRGVHERAVREDEALRDRLHLELSLIRRMGFAAYFLTVADIVADVKTMGIRAACRGSAAGSLVCFLTGISDVDALRHDLSFERFMNPMRTDLPDIDIDVESARREDVYDMILSRHGEERAACVAMIDTYRARSAIREVGKALALPEVELGMIATSFPHISARHLREAIDRLPELQGINLRFEQLELLFSVAERIAGFPRHIALHPCGIVLASHDLVERVPLERSANGHRMIQADKDDVELLGYLKLDVLGVRMLSSMRHALDEIARTTGEKVDLDRIPTDDEPTFELIRRSDTLGCFQIESPGQRELLQKLQPTRWEDLIVDISLFRPGPVKSDMIAPYLRRRAGMEPPRYIHPDLRGPLQETHGVIVFHEQVIRTLAALAGYTETYADHVRRHLDDEDLLPSLRADFLERAVARGVEPDAAEKIWHAVAQFASFGFCKAHAAAFAVPTYQSAYLKAHYPAHLVAGLLTHDPGMYPRRLILEDARHHDIEILPLDVNESEPDYVVEEVGPGRVRVPPERRRAQRAKRAETSSSGGNPTEQRSPAPTLRGPARAQGRSRDLGRGDPVPLAGALRAAVHRRGGLHAADHREPAGHRGDRSCGGVRRAAGGGEPAEPGVHGDDGGSTARRRPADAHRRGRAGPRVQGLFRRRGRAGRTGGARDGREPAHRELLRSAPGGSRGHAHEGPGLAARRDQGDGGGGEGGLADAGDPQRPADHLPDARRRHRARRGHRVRVGTAEGGEDGLPRVRAGRVGGAPAHRGEGGQYHRRGGLGPHRAAPGPRPRGAA